MRETNLEMDKQEAEMERKERISSRHEDEGEIGETQRQREKLELLGKADVRRISPGKRQEICDCDCGQKIRHITRM